MYHHSKARPWLIGALALLSLTALSHEAQAQTNAVSSIPALISAPATLVSGPPPVLLYRAAPTPAGQHNGVAFWLRGDGSGGSIRVLIFASGGHAADPLPVPGSGKDTQPLWPAWVSSPVSVDFTGWKRILLGPTDFTYRAPLNDQMLAPDFSTADAFGFSSNKQTGTLYTDGVVWAHVDAQGEATGESVTIDDFHQGDVASWRAKGTPESVQGFVYGVSTQPNFVKEAQVSLKLDYSVASQLRALRRASVVQSLKVLKTPYLVSVPASPFERELPDTLPQSTELTSRISVFACPEQTQPASFCIYASKKPLNNVTVLTKSDLFRLTSRIPKSAIDVRVVKVWPRLGMGVFRDPDEYGLEPELLVKDDRVALSANGATLPDVRLTGDPVTDIPAYTQKQFWVTVSVPRDTKPGDYTGQLMVSADGVAPFSVSLDVNVLPLRLLSPAKQYTIGLRSHLTPAPAAMPDPSGVCLYTDFVSREQLAAQIADITSHGFRYLTLPDQGPALMDEVANATSDNVGMPLIYSGLPSDNAMDAAEAVEKQAASGRSVSFNYLIPSGPHQADTMAAFKKAGLSTVALVPDQATFDTLKDNLDVPIYSVDEPYSQYLIAHSGQRTSDKRDWWVWPSGQIDPQVNRLYAGYLLWRGNLYGAYVGDYQTCYGSNPYDDSDPGAPASACAMRPAMMTYPAADGVIDTIQWEAVREGITDVRYLTTFYTALRECKDAHIAKAMVTKDESDVTAFIGKPFWLMTDADYQKGRLMIASETVQLRQTVDLYNKKLLAPIPAIKGNPKSAANKKSTPTGA